MQRCTGGHRSVGPHRRARTRRKKGDPCPISKWNPCEGMRERGAPPAGRAYPPRAAQGQKNGGTPPSRVRSQLTAYLKGKGWGGNRTPKGTHPQAVCSPSARNAGAGGGGGGPNKERGEYPPSRSTRPLCLAGYRKWGAPPKTCAAPPPHLETKQGGGKGKRCGTGRIHNQRGCPSPIRGEGRTRGSGTGHCGPNK